MVLLFLVSETTTRKTMMPENHVEDRQKNPIESDANDKPKRICLIGALAGNVELVRAAQTLDISVISSNTGLEVICDTSWKTYFILDDFHGPIYEAICKAKHKYVIEFIYSMSFFN